MDWRVQTVRTHQHAKIGHLLATILWFVDFLRCWPPPSQIFEFAKFYWLALPEGGSLITVPTFVKIGYFFAAILRFFEFNNGRCRRLGFLKSLHVIGWRDPESHLQAKFRQNQSIGWFFFADRPPDSSHVYENVSNHDYMSDIALALRFDVQLCGTEPSKLFTHWTR